MQACEFGSIYAKGGFGAVDRSFHRIEAEVLKVRKSQNFDLPRQCIGDQMKVLQMTREGGKTLQWDTICMALVQIGHFDGGRREDRFCEQTCRVTDQLDVR